MFLPAADLTALLDGLSATVLLLDAKTGCITICELPGWLEGLDVSRPLVDSALPQDKQALLDAMAAVQHTSPVSVEARLRAGGREVWVRASLARRQDGIALALQDVTAARHDARQWRELEAWLVTLGETLPFDFFILDREGRYLLQNPPSVKRVGTALGKRFSELGLPTDVQQLWGAGVERARAGHLVREELTWLVDGTPRTFSHALSPVRDGDAVVGVLGVDIDITPLKESEAALRRSLGELEATQEALVRKKQLAALGEMAAIVAHEVRNPLGSISNVVTLLQRGMVSREEERELWQVIADETKRLDLLVANLLDFVRPVTLTLSPRPLEPLLERALQQTLWTEDASRRVKTSVEGSAPPVPLDAGQLELAFTNLFRNAVQAMKGDGSLHVRISTEEHRAQRWARVTIRDTGPGLPSEVQERMFEPFVTTRARGHGLGLAIVRKVVEQHHGEVSFESEAGRGTTCVVRLPMTS